VENIPLWSFNNTAHTMVSCINGHNHKLFRVITQLNTFIYETMKCLLHQSHLLNSLWLEAIKIACYLLNFHITKSSKNLTLQQAFIGGKQDVFHLGTFGTWVYVHILTHRRSKMDSKASKCILLGDDKSTKG